MKKLTYLFLALLIVACSDNSSDDEGNPCNYNPTLTISAVTNITDTSATLNGVISIVSENCIDPNNIEQGFVYATTIQPTTANNKVNVNGTDISTTLENLEPNTTYYARTFLTNSDGEFYGNEVSFVTEIRLDFSPAFTFAASGFIAANGAAGMIGSSLDNSLFIAHKESINERILKINLANNNITEKIFGQLDFVTKRLHIRGNQLIVVGGQYVNTYNLDLSGGDPISVLHGKELTRFGMTVFNDDAYIIGGDINETEANKILSWNIETETFTEFTSLPETTFRSGGTIVNDNLYVFGGCSDWLDTGTASTTAYKINMNNPSNVETFEIDQAIDVAFVRRFQNLIYIAGQTTTIEANGEISAVNPIVAVYNTSDNTYQEFYTNLNNTSGFDTILQMCIVNGKMYIIYGGPDNGGQWEVLVSDLP